jgi:hypothetical protein
MRGVFFCPWGEFEKPCQKKKEIFVYFAYTTFMLKYGKI